MKAPLRARVGRRIIQIGMRIALGKRDKYPEVVMTVTDADGNQRWAT